MKRAASGILPVIAVDRNLPKALHQQIYDAYRAAIVDGSLRPGQRIPSTRMLASEIGVSRFPVLNAYAQLLAEGYFESRVGRRNRDFQFPSGSTDVERAGRQRPRANPFWTSAGRESLFDPSPCCLPPLAAELGSISCRAGGVRPISSPRLVQPGRAPLPNMDAQSFHYGDQMGSMALRETIANYLKTARSLHCEAEQIMIVGGSQQALEISARVLLDPGNSVWVEQPGYRLARDVFALSGCHPVPVAG